MYISASQKPLRHSVVSGSCSQQFHPTASVLIVGGERCITQVRRPQPGWPPCSIFYNCDFPSNHLTLKQFALYGFSHENSNDDTNEDANDVPPAQGWNFSYLMCTTQRLMLIPLFAPSLRATSTESFRGGCWLFASASLGVSDVPAALKLMLTSVFSNNKCLLFHHMSETPNLKLSMFLTGPSSCEEERRAATDARSVYVPSCEPGGAFTTRQCQQGGQCWCVDHTGQELPGTRQQGPLDCSECPKPGAGMVFVIFIKYGASPHLFLWCTSNLTELGPDSCPAMRQQALFQFLSGSVAVPLQTSITDRSQTSCNSLIQALRDLLPVEVESPPFLSQLVEVVDGLFRTVGGALRALSRSSPQRLHENLFGGKFLKEIASSNFSGVVGSQGTFVRDWVSGKGDSLQENRVLVESVSRVLGDLAFLSGLKVALQGHSSLLPPEQVNRKNVC